MKRTTVSMGAFGAPRTRATIEARERAKRTELVFRCRCGEAIAHVRAHAAMGQTTATVTLVRQAHRRHQAEAGCGQELA